MIRWAGILLHLVVPAMITVYTVNFGRWMGRNQHLMGAIGAYLIAAAAFLLSVWAVLNNP